MTPKISFQTLRAVARVICGDPALGSTEPISPYRTQRRLTEFFLEDLALERPETVEGTSRLSWTEAWLKAFNGTSQLRRIIEAAVRPVDFVDSDFDIAATVKHLNGLLNHDNLKLVKSGDRYILSSSSGVQLPDPTEAEIDILSDTYIQELAAKCDMRMADCDFEGAITVARTMLEAVLGELEECITGTRADYKGNMPKQFKAVSKLLRMDDERPDLDDRFKDVIRGLVMVANGLAPLRNKMSDGHARQRKPAPHHARVVVNAAKTVATFLIESYVYQIEKGLLPTSETSSQGDLT